MRMRKCRWHCDRMTKNLSGICDLCWADRDRIFAERKAREAAAEKKPLTAVQEQSLIKARAAKLLKQTHGNAGSQQAKRNNGILP